MQAAGSSSSAPPLPAELSTDTGALDALQALLASHSVDLASLIQPTEPQPGLQTRSGRISRPPQHPVLPYYAHQQAKAYDAAPPLHAAPRTRTPATRATAPPPAPRPSGQSSARPGRPQRKGPGRPTIFTPEEAEERKRERNKEASFQAREKKRLKLERADEVESELAERTAECERLRARCAELEALVQTLQSHIGGSFTMPPPMPTAQAALPIDLTAKHSATAVSFAPTTRYISSPGPKISASRDSPPPRSRRSHHAPEADRAPSPPQPARPLAERTAPDTYAANHTTPSMLPDPSSRAQSSKAARAPPPIPPRSTRPPAPPPSTHGTPQTIPGPSTPLESTLTPGVPTPLTDANIAAVSELDQPSSSTGGDEYDALSLSALFTFDDLPEEAEDEDFVPPTSPKPGSDSDSSDDEGEPEDFSPEPERSDGEKRGEKRRRSEDGDEDMFLPIRDVPIPMESVYAEAMAALGVRTKGELTKVVTRIVEGASRGHVSADEVEVLRRLVLIAEAQGMYAGDK